MIIIYIKEKCVFCKIMGNIMKIYILCKFENVVNIFFELIFFVFRCFFKNLIILFEKNLKDF